MTTGTGGTGSRAPSGATRRGRAARRRGRERHPVTHVAYEDAARVRRVGRQGAADRGRMGVRRARRPRRRGLHVGRRVRAPRPDDGQHLAGRVPVAEPADRPLRGHVAGQGVPGQRLSACSTWRATSGSGRRDFYRPTHPERGPRLLRPVGPRVNPRVTTPDGSTTSASRARSSRGWSSRAARTCAPRTTASATGPRPASRSRWRRRWPTWASAASSVQHDPNLAPDHQETHMTAASRHG